VEAVPTPPEAARLAAYRTASTSLALRSDRELADLLDTATPLGTGIGGRSSRLDVDGTPVFVKRVPLTELELRPENVHSTANLFALPTHCQYGVGSPGFGAWRELAVHTMTTGWVLAGDCPNFPLTYHWRVLPEPAPPPLPPELADAERVSAFWGDDPGVRARIQGLARSPASLALFLEYVPQTLHDWLTAQVRAGGDHLDRACALADRELAATTAFTTARGLQHFDAHFLNVLTDGRRLYLTDFGLALSSRFTLTPPEAAFLSTHQTYDRAYTRSWLVNWLLTALCAPPTPEARRTLVRSLPAGAPTAPPATRALLARHAAVSQPMTAFYLSLLNGDTRTPYPAKAGTEAQTHTPGGTP
jgi:hypothetical protein